MHGGQYRAYRFVDIGVRRVKSILSYIEVTIIDRVLRILQNISKLSHLCFTNTVK